MPHALLDPLRAIPRPRSWNAAPAMVPGLHGHDPLAIVYSHWATLLAQGDIVWGYAIRWSEEARRPHPSRAFTTWFVHPRHEALDVGPAELERAAFEARAPRGSPVDEDLALLGRTLAEPRSRFFSAKLPFAVTAGRPLYASTTIVTRAHLPRPALGSLSMPLLVHPETATVIPVPSCYWPEPLVDAWLALAST